MRFVLTRDAEDFAARAAGFLAERAERNVLATVLVDARSGRFAEHNALFALGLDDREQVRAAALRTPPWPLLASDIDEPNADRLIELWLAEDPDLSGVSGQPAAARAVAAAWRRLTGGHSRCRMRDAMHSLTEVEGPSRPAPGRLRVADGANRELLIAWERAFMAEAAVGVRSEAEQAVAARLADGSQLLWEDDVPVCTADTHGPRHGR